MRDGDGSEDAKRKGLDELLDDRPFRLDDPNQASRGDGETKNKRADDPADSSPKARKFLDDVARPGSLADEILLKLVSRWTNGELGVVMGARLDLPSGHPERDRMADKETASFKRIHGAGTARRATAGG